MRGVPLLLGLDFFCPLRPLPRNVAFALSRITLSVLTLALCLLTLPLSEVLCLRTLVLCILALVLTRP
jgi:hypothetical protein